ncbi:serine hydrolase [Burkholderia sp. Ac-20353]|uniref:serine hydrolase domain-containing protein n=1 Tax=Burkholderia sp. Ac-20353 TaxID=2703894 RepID=UPI00197B0846|nr:serine hydrolase [Burkholderia sp. Ac-20353]MBN3788243.1 serine hydrolase [Burkholderia sp. Ac-20353]
MYRTLPLAVPRRLAILALCLAVAGCAGSGPDRALRVATGTVAHNLCSETFVSGLDPDRAYAEGVAPMPGFGLVRWGVRYDVDRTQQVVQATFLGGFRSRAVYRGVYGCMLTFAPRDATTRDDSAPPSAALPRAERHAESPPVATADPRVGAALDAAFAESATPPYSGTKAVVVLHDGKLVAERYAPGYAPDTPVLGYSLTKSVTNALVGILVREGRLSVDARAPLAAWQHAGDPRGDITLAQLMHMTSGLDLDETGSGFDPSNRMFYDEPDMAGFAERARLVASPGSRWAYSSASTHLVARIVRDAAGGTGDAVQRFAADALFGPLQMRNVTLEMDATGTPVGAHYMLASARDWARFGQLYLDDGVVDGKRVLPEGWVRWSTTPGAGTNYGAGWWVNRRDASTQPAAGGKTGMPLMPSVTADAFYALGNLGQFVVVVPSSRLVVVRVGRSHRPFFGIADVERLVAACVAAQR